MKVISNFYMPCGYENTPFQEHKNWMSNENYFRNFTINSSITSIPELEGSISSPCTIS